MVPKVHEECFQFFEDEQYSIARSQMPRKEPLERSLESYKANNKKIIENGAGMDLSSIQSFGDLYTAIGKAIHKRWTEEKENLKSYLEDGLKDPEPLPVARVSLPVALAYALTRRPARSDHRRRCLGRRKRKFASGP